MTKRMAPSEAALPEEKELLRKIQENLAVAKQAAQQLSAKHKDKLNEFIKEHLNQANIEEIVTKTFIDIFNEIVSGQLQNDFYQWLQALSEERTRKKGNPRPMVLPPLDLQASGPVTDRSDEALLSEITQCIHNIRTSVDELFGMHGSNLLERVKPYVNYDLDDAKDVVQDTHLRAYCKIYTLFYDKYGNPKASVDHEFLAWLHTIAFRVIIDGIRKPQGPVVDFPENEEGEEFEPPNLKGIEVSRQATLSILAPQLLHKVASQNEPPKFFVFVFKGLINWGPTDIVEKFSAFTLEELRAQLRERCMHLFEWSPETADWVLSPLQNQLGAHGKRRLGDYFGKDPENDIQMWFRSAIRRVRKGSGPDHLEIMKLVNWLKGV